MFNSNSINKYIKRISKIKSKSFSQILLKEIDLFLDNNKSTIKFVDDKLIIECDDNELKVVLEKHGGISYEIRKYDMVVTGQYGVYKNGYFVKTDDKKSSVYCVDNAYSKDISYKQIFRVFDKKGIEQFRRVTFKVDNYQEDMETGVITLNEPDIMENYAENYYIYRADERYVLKRVVKKYVYPDGTSSFINIRNCDDCFIRYGLIDKESKELPNYGEFYGVDSEIFFNYFQKKSTINDVVDNFHSKKYRRITNIL